MLSFLTSLSSKAYLIIGAVLVSMIITLSGITYFIYKDNQELSSDLKSYELALDASVDISNKNVKKLEDYKQITEHKNKVLEKAHKKELKRVKSFANRKNRIKNVQKKDDAINAPVLVDTTKWMREKAIIANRNKDNKSNDTTKTAD